MTDAPIDKEMNRGDLTDAEEKFLARINKFYKFSRWGIYYLGGLAIIMFGAVVYFGFKTERIDLINSGIRADLLLIIAFIYTLTMRKFIRIVNKLRMNKQDGENHMTWKS